VLCADASLVEENDNTMKEQPEERNDAGIAAEMTTTDVLPEGKSF